MEKDELGNRMKLYESIETDRIFVPRLPVYARLDGRGFSKFTKTMTRPFDENLYQCMLNTVIHLVQKTNPRIAYFQSDEISLCWDYNNVPFNGKIFKAVSTLASEATAKFVIEANKKYPLLVQNLVPHFDARVINLPNKDEVANAFLWRNLDCIKNAISQTASFYFSHKELLNKTGIQKIEMLNDLGINYENSISPKYRFGTWVRTEPVILNGEHGDYTRNHIVILTKEVGKFVNVENRVSFIFDKVQPLTNYKI